MRFFGILLFVAVVITAALYLAGRGGDPVPAQNTMQNGAEDAAGITVEKADIAVTGSKLPVGFPRDIPLDSQNIIESYRVVYGEHGAVQYTVSYTSLKSRDSLWDTYNAYMKDAGYSVDTNATSKSLGQVSGARAGDSLSVVLSVRSGVTLAQVNLLDRSE